MAERLAVLYETWKGRSAPSDPVSFLKPTGLRLLHPLTHSVRVLDDQGRAIGMNEPDFLRHMQQGKDVSFQWWFAEDHDVYCRIEVRNHARVIELGMEGCSPDELERIRQVMLDRFLGNHEGSIGLVFDPIGVSEDYDWDRYFLRGKQLNWETDGLGIPALLGVRRGDFQRIKAFPIEVHVEVVGNLVVVSTDTTST